MTKIAGYESKKIMQGMKEEAANDTFFRTSQDVLDVARQRWLKNREVLYVLMNYQSLELEFAREVVCPPTSGLLVLYDKNVVKRFRRDEHDWKKKKDGKAVREDHEKLKIDGVERLTCCYAHSREIPTFHRRIYWLLPQQDVKATSPLEEGRQVLVHYLDERCILGDSPAAVGRSQFTKSMAKRSRADKAGDMRGESPAGRSARPPAGVTKGWAQILTSSTKPYSSDHDTHTHVRAQQSNLARLLAEEGTTVKEEAESNDPSAMLSLMQDAAPQHPREEPFPCGPEVGNREDAWKYLAHQVVFTDATGTAGNSNWHELINNTDYPDRGAGELKEEEEHSPVWQSLVDKALQHETSNHVCMQWQHLSHSSLSSHSSSLYPSWQSFTERISHSAQHLSDHLEPEALLNLPGESRMPLDEEYIMQDDADLSPADLSALLGDHQDVLGPQPFHCCQFDGTEKKVASFPDYSDALTGQQLIGRHPSGPESNHLRHLRDWERILTCRELQQHQMNMDIGRAFDALQEGAASSSQVKEQWHSMVAQVKNKRQEDDFQMQEGSDGEMEARHLLGKAADELGPVLEEDMMLN